VHEELM